MKIGKCILIVVAVIFLTVGGTFAYWSGRSNNVNVNASLGNINNCVRYTKGTNLTSSNFMPSASYTGGASTTITFYRYASGSNSCNINSTIYGTISIKINSIGTNLKSEAGFKYALVSGSTVLAQGTFSGKSAGTYAIKSNIALSTTSTTYTLYVWLDKSMDLNEKIVGESFNMELVVSATNKPN
mgnify:FL=1